MNEATQTLDNLNPVDESILYVSPEDIILEEQIGSGQSGRVFKGILKTLVSGIKMQRTISIKEIRIKYTDTLFDVNNRIKDETIRFKNIIHRNVILPLGICEIEHKSTLVLMEYAGGGDLCNFLQDSKLQISMEVFLNWALQILQGLEAIHINDLMHCDLKAKNVILSFYPRNHEQMMNVVLKISNISHFSSSGTPTHMAPESIKRIMCKCSDIWSYGVVLWEILSRKKPFDGLEPLQIIYKVGVKKDTLEISKDVDISVSSLIKRCWEYNHFNRPTSLQIREELLRIKEKFKFL